MKKVTKYQLSVISILLLAMSFTAQAQSSDTLKMTLDQCIDYAIKNSLTVKNSTLDEELAKARVGEIRAAGLPQANGSVALQENAPLRKQFFGSNALSLFGGASGSSSSIKPVAANPDFIVTQNVFQLPTAGDANIQVSQLLFSGSYLMGLKAAKVYKELASKGTEQSKVQTTANVIKAYYMVLINRERLDLFNSNITRLEDLLRQTSALQANGFAEKLDVQRLEVTYNNIVTEKEKFLNLYELSKILLKYQMNMPLGTELKPSMALSEIQLDTNKLNDLEVDYNRRPEYKTLKVQQRLNKMDIQNNQIGYAPTLVASATFGMFTQSNAINGYLLQSKYWFNYNLVQVALNVPIFDGFSKAYKIQQSKINLQKTEVNIKALENNINLQTQSSIINIKNATKSLDVQKKNMELAKAVVDITQKKYKAGTASNLEVTTAENDLKQSQINYYNAYYDVLVYQVDYQQAMGNITYNK